MTRHPAWRELRVPLARDGLEALRTRLRELSRLAGLAGIDPGGELLTGHVALRADGFESHLGIDAEREAVLPTAVAVLPALPLPPGRADFEVQAAAVEQLKGFGSRLGRAECGVGQRHVGATPFGGSPVAPKVAPILGAAFIGWLGNMPDTIREKLQL